MPTTAAIGRARRRLGPEPLNVLFDRVCRPVATPETVGAWYRRWRLVAVDGTVFDVPDTDANGESFGRPGSGRGQQRSAYPQVRVAALVECGRTRCSPPRLVPCRFMNGSWSRTSFLASSLGCC
ncbi:hypothetical protein [Streptomyces cinereoruber]|uniref:hypothetical protein n=1 Tax=Streptomyces cinereoruber TaxID=67260 RepID=UPI003632838B